LEKQDMGGQNLQLEMFGVDKGISILWKQRCCEAIMSLHDVVISSWPGHEE
jgi:hypothetical protein